MLPLQYSIFPFPGQILFYAIFWTCLFLLQLTLTISLLTDAVQTDRWSAIPWCAVQSPCSGRWWKPQSAIAEGESRSARPAKTIPWVPKSTSRPPTRLVWFSVENVRPVRALPCYSVGTDAMSGPVLNSIVLSAAVDRLTWLYEWMVL